MPPTLLHPDSQPGLVWEELQAQKVERKHNIVYGLVGFLGGADGLQEEGHFNSHPDITARGVSYLLLSPTVRQG